MNINLLKSAPVLYMGTPDFSVIPLSALFENGYNIIGAVTQPDKPKGRGYMPAPSPVKVYAAEHGIDVYQPATLKKTSFSLLLKKLAPELIIVAAYGKILPPDVIAYPKYGCINVHGSLLPKYRGAAPIQRAIIDSENVTGVTIINMDNGIDTGDMLYSEKTPILPGDNFETIHDRLALIGAQALIKTLDLMSDGKVIPQKQDNNYATYTSKIEKEDCVLDFTQSAEQLHNRIRGLSPVPLCVTSLRGKNLKIIESAVFDEKTDAHAGTVLSVSDGIIRVACGSDVIGIKTLLPEGKRRMTASDFINGRGITAGEILGDIK
jgi:methionyl-tRNA formyltransferase